MTQDGFALKRRRTEDFECGVAQVSGFEVTPLVKQKERLIEVDQRWPYRILFFNEDLPCLGEKFHGPEGLLLLAHRGSEVRVALGGFVSHAEGLEQRSALCRRLGCLCAQVELEVDLGKVHVTKRVVVLLLVCLTD